MTDIQCVGLVQVGDNFGDQYYLPYSVGILQAYAESKLKNPKNFKFLLPVYKRGDIQEVVNRLKCSQIVFFSTYLWNFQYSLEIAKRLKKEQPSCVVVFGGPQVPENKERLCNFLNKYKQVDIGCCGEGEPAFLSILENYSDRHNWSYIPTIAFLDKNGSFIKTKIAERIRDLDEIPSPYISKIFEPLIEKNPEENWSALFETNRGCPFSCAFCAWGAGGKQKVFKFDVSRIYEEINWFSENKIEFIFCCDANFGMFPRDLEITTKVAENKNKSGYPMRFSVQNTKNSTKKVMKLQEILDKSDLQKGVNLALQSVNPETLSSVNRANIKESVYQDLQEEFTRKGIPTFSDIILGLPNETYQSFTKGVSSIIASGQHNRIQFINLTVLENTEMANKEYIAKYGLVLQESTIISHHTSIENNDILETQNLVVGSKSMPKDDWITTRVFCWLTSLFHFNKILQIPFIILNEELEISYKDLIESFLYATRKKNPIISGMVSELKKIAVETQKGNGEYVPSKEWLNVWWPADEYLFIRMIFNKELDLFYDEAEKLLSDYLKSNKLELQNNLLKESILLNKSLIKTPSSDNDISINLSYNIPEYYTGILRGQKVTIKQKQGCYSIKRSDETWDSQDKWLRESVWYSTKKGNFLYKLKLSSK
jgi:radical SAM superfamily enzyme YgiQ (UPF0313 family)